MDLRKLKEQLDVGEVNQSTKDYLKNILERSEELTKKGAEDSLNERLLSAGEREAIDLEERSLIDEKYDEAMATIKKEEESLAKIVLIMNYEKNIEDVKQEYIDMIKEMENNLSEMKDSFTEKFGNVEEFKRKHGII